MKLYHFTCHHGREGIGSQGMARPNAHPAMPNLQPVVWLTSDPQPRRDDVGLTMGTLIQCDRMAHRYRVLRVRNPVPWADLRERVDAQLVEDLERFSAPETWWLSFLPVKLRLDREWETYRGHVSP